MIRSQWGHRFGLNNIPRHIVYLARVEDFADGLIRFRPWTFNTYEIAEEFDEWRFRDRQFYLGTEADLSWLLVDKSAFYPYSQRPGLRRVTLDPGYIHVILTAPDSSQGHHIDWLEFLTQVEPPKPVPKVKTRTIWDRIK